VQEFVWNSFLKVHPTLHYYAKGPYEGSLYYSAVPTYSAVHTCNTWVAEALKAGALHVHTAGVVFAAQLWSQLRSLDTAAPAPTAGSASPISSLQSAKAPGPKGPQQIYQ
jgi:hypothetical protein